MKLPLEYRWLKANGFNGFVPWLMLDEPGVDGLRAEFKKETGEDFFPFAVRQDCDDVAGFRVLNGEIQKEVISTHLTWSSRREYGGFPSTAIFKDMFEWLKEVVIVDSWDWMSEEELEDIEQGL